MAQAAAAALPGIVQGASTVMAAQATGNAMENQAKFGLQGTREQLDEQRNEFAARRKAYEESLGRGQTQFGQGESAFLETVNQANPELAQQEADIRSGASKGMQDTSHQISANLATQGIRGGQAGTLLNRGVGEVGTQAIKDINTMQYQDAATRAAMKAAYLAAKAGKGQSATLGMGSF